MGSKTRKAQCTTLYVCDSIKEKCSQKLRSILGVLPWARTKNEYTMDDFPMLTIREPWLLKKLSTSTVSTWLAGKGIDATRSSRLAAWDQVIRTFQKIITKKGRLMTEFHNLLCERWLQVGTSKNNLAHTFTYFVKLRFDNSLFLRCENFQSWCDEHAREDTMHMLVWYGAHDAH
jgi:hypothetical protein